MKAMRERDNGIAGIEVPLPFHAVCRVCRNSLTNVCIEQCAVRQDFSWFAAKDLSKECVIPLFPRKDFEELPVEIQLATLTAYIDVIVRWLNWTRS